MSRLPRGEPQKSSFSKARLNRLAEIERWHFWFSGRRILVNRFIEKYTCAQPYVMDVGCGTGWGMNERIRTGWKIAGLDIRPEGLREAQKLSHDALLFQADAEKIPINRHVFDLIVMLDVLEHGDDELILDNVYRILKPNGILVLSVPALRWLWSTRDLEAGHQQRYTRRSLHQKLTDSGFSIVEMRYYQFILLPLTIISRLLGKRNAFFRDMEDQPSTILNTILGWVTRMEVTIGQFISWPWGSSIIAVCKK